MEPPRRVLALAVGLALGVAALVCTNRVSTAANDGLWEELVVPAVSGPSAIYDPLRHQVIVFGGYNDGNYVNGVWALSLDGAPVWTALAPAGPKPTPRHNHSAIYDPVRDRMIVFGGYDSASDHYRNDVWALSLGGVPEWQQLTPGGPPPAGRWRHSAIYDAVSDRMVIYGGNSLFVSARNDAWALSLAGDPVWTALTPAGAIPGRMDHSAIYDPVRNRMLVFGGHVSSQVISNEVWTLSLADSPSWTAETTAGPATEARSGHLAIYDPVRDRMLVVGGNDAGELRNDICTLSLSGVPTWSTLASTGTPPTPRNDAGAIYDPEGDRLVAYGGYDEARRNDTWQLSLASTPTWTELTPAVVPPAARGYHTATYDPVRDRMVVFGGTRDQISSYNDTWALSLGNPSDWTVLFPAGSPPTGRAGHSAVYDPVRDRIVVFGGGASYAGFSNEAWVLSLAETPSWTMLTPAGTPPPMRVHHSAIYDPIRDRMLVFGGRDNTFHGRDDVWELSFTGSPSWSELAPTGVPPGAREGHSAIYDPVRDQMLIFGGTSGLSGPVVNYNDVWALSLAGTPAWTKLTPVGLVPSARAFHSAIYDPVRDRMLVYGAWSADDLWELGFVEGQAEWRELTAANPPPIPRVLHGAIYDPVRERMVVFGGGNYGFTNDTWAMRTGVVLDVEAPGSYPSLGFLRPLAPNPSGGTTSVSYSLTQPGRVQLGVYDTGGRLVRMLVNGARGTGLEVVPWDGTGDDGARLGAGVYFVRLAGPGIRDTRKVVLLR